MALRLDIKKTLRCGSRTFDLDAAFVAEGRSIVLFGPSGSGKTLTLRALAGLITPDAGRIELDGRALFDSAIGVDMPARKRGVGLVFQDYALFPHLSVAQNVGFGLGHGLPGLLGRLDAAGRARVAELLDLAGLTGLAEARTDRLSGGQRQRVALLRALARRPQALLLDEPFSALDPLLRLRMRREVRATCHELGTPTVLITHDPEDVAAFGGTVVLYDEGRVRRAVTFADGPEGGALARALVLAERFSAYG
ncbi:MAG: ATP-binding cassette domain-containing protein [Proteobacteria bacterium]|nr:ATP-binding cassette domain-containing protein [Pseudomonadota bacterium]MBU1594150.1 ATP-binding cassette domain-containing protein [Pseudomonadota bacterium]